MALEISKELFSEIDYLIENQLDKSIQELLNDEHHADIAEVLDELNLSRYPRIIKLRRRFCRWINGQRIGKG